MKLQALAKKDKSACCGPPCGGLEKADSDPAQEPRFEQLHKPVLKPEPVKKAEPIKKTKKFERKLQLGIFKRSFSAYDFPQNFNLPYWLFSKIKEGICGNQFLLIVTG